MAFVARVLACFVLVGLGGCLRDDEVDRETDHQLSTLVALARLLYAMPSSAITRPYHGSSISNAKPLPRHARNHAQQIAQMSEGASDPTNAKEILELGSEERDQSFDEAVAEENAVARSDEAIAAQRALAQTAVKALQGNTELATLLEKKGKKNTGKLAKALKSRAKGNMKLLGEAVNFESISFGGYDLDDPAYLSREFRVGGCQAVMVPMDYDFALGPDALKKTVDEQSIAKGEFPGSLPIIARVPAIDALQLAQVAAQGADGIAIPLLLTGEDKTRELMAVADDLGLETILRVTSAEECVIALDLGAKIILIGDMTLSEAAEIRDTLPKEVVSIADTKYDEVRGAWKFRDAGFDALVTGIALPKIVAKNRIPPAAVLEAMLSKGSVKFGLGMKMGRMEGAKENLGSLAM